MYQEFPSPSRLIEAAEQFFSKCKPEELPEVLTNTERKWVVINYKWFMALFCLSPKAVSRMRNFQDKGWDRFPALFTQSEEEERASMGAGGRRGFYSSNTSGGSFAFKVKRKASFILQNHRHTFTDPEGKSITYIVELSFVVGMEASETGETLEDIFHSLFERLRSVWNSSK